MASVKLSSLYGFIESMPPNVIFSYVALAFGLLFLSRFIQVGLNHLLAIGLGGMFIIYIHQKRTLDKTTQMEELYKKLHNIVPTPSYFHLDTNLIELIDDIKEYRELNERAWSELIFQCDNFLHLVDDVMNKEVHDIKENIDVAQHLMKNAVDQLQSVLFSLETDRDVEYKLERAIYTLRLFLQRHIDRMILKLQEKNKEQGMNVKSGVLYLDDPEPLNPDQMRKYFNYN